MTAFTSFSPPPDVQLVNVAPVRERISFCSRVNSNTEPFPDCLMMEVKLQPSEADEGSVKDIGEGFSEWIRGDDLSVISMKATADNVRCD